MSFSCKGEIMKKLNTEKRKHRGAMSAARRRRMRWSRMMSELMEEAMTGTIARLNRGKREI
jgi:hypothetical protein